MNETVAVLEEIGGDVTVDDDSVVTVQTEVTDGQLRVQAPEHAPLSSIEPHAHLTLTDGTVSVNLVFDAEQRDALVEALQGGGGDE
jgi:hypothetical protein